MFEFGIGIVDDLHGPQGDRIGVIPQLLKEVLSLLVAYVLAGH